MKLLTFKYEGKEELGVLNLREDGVHCLKDIGILYTTMNELIEAITDEEMHKIEQYIKAEGSKGISIDLIEKQAPIPCPKQDIICLGINYMKHAEESARYKKEAFGGDRPFPVYFSKRVNEAVGDGGYIQSHKEIVDSLDYEVELAVIIKKDAKDVSESQVRDYIFGYTIINDVSARTLQTKHKQWYFGKSLDGFTPMGPWIVTRDEIQYPPHLKITSYVNEELRQDATTDLLIFGIDYVVSELSKGMTLKAGTIISMGTPAGVGMGFTPPKFLKSGDTVRCEIEGIGSLTNCIS